MENYSAHIYTIKDDSWLLKQRYAGMILQQAIALGISVCNKGVTTKEVDSYIDEYIVNHYGCTPTFKGYKGFPTATCISVNNELVHGIPNSYILQEGDVVKIDSGVTYREAIADMARTIVVGEYKDEKHKQLIQCCYDALNAAINSFKFEKGYLNRLGNIGYAITKEARKINANVIVNLGGHGFERNEPHGMPFVSNVGSRDDGPIIYSGTTLAIEPMFTFGSTETNISEDKWTLSLNDIGVHFEDTIFVHEDRIEILTRG